MKKLLIPLFCFGLLYSSIAFADLTVINNPNAICIPALVGGYVISGEALYLDPSINSVFANYAVINGQSRNINVKPDLGWQLGVGYIFSGTPFDVNLNFLRFDTDANDTVITNTNITPANFLLNFVFVDPTNVGFASGLFNFASGLEEFDLDQLDFTLGQQFNFGQHFILHPNVGVRYIDLEHILTGKYFGVETGMDPSATFFSAPVNLTATNDSNVKGLGPLLGLDANYLVGYGFSLVGHVNTAFLIARRDTTFQIAIAIPPIENGISPFFPENSVFANSFFQRDKESGIATLEAKVGADYTYLFNNRISTLTLEAGYQFDKFFNVVDMIKGSGVLTFFTGTPPNIFFTSLVNATDQTASIDFRGPYVKLTFRE